MIGEHGMCTELKCHCNCHTKHLPFTCPECKQKNVLFLDRLGVIFHVKDECEHVKEAVAGHIKLPKSKEGTEILYKNSLRGVNG